MSTVLRNPDGSILYPSEIPPAVDFPQTPGESIEPKVTNVQSDVLADSSLPVVHETRRASVEVARPGLNARQWMTERPRPTARISKLPAFRRQGTNSSALNEALWNKAPLRDESSSTSSSSSSEDEDEEAAERHEEQNKPQGRAGGTGKKERTRSDGKQQREESGNRYRKFRVGNDEFKTKGRVSKKDGRLNISVNETNNSGYLAKALGASFLKHLAPTAEDEEEDQAHGSARQGVSRESSASTIADTIPRPKLNIVVMVIGSRGDIQPFLKIGKILKEEYGHRVRIATHPAFRDFVEKDSGLDFFSVGGDPAELMAFMVKNPGM
jgi:hypothetical protein